MSHDMLGEFFTKCLQGTPFTRMREKIQNPPANKNAVVHRSVMENDQKSVIKAKEEKSNAGVKKNPHGTKINTTGLTK